MAVADGVGVSIDASVAVAVAVSIILMVGVGVGIGKSVAVGNRTVATGDIAVLATTVTGVDDRLFPMIVMTSWAAVPVGVRVSVACGTGEDSDVRVPVGLCISTVTNSAATQTLPCKPTALTRYHLPSEEIPTTVIWVPRFKLPTC